MTEFIPTNNLEVALEQAHQGLLPVPSLLRVLVDSDLAVPSATEVMGNGQGFQPLLFSKEQTQMLACFTDKARIGEFTSVAPYCLVMKGRELLRRVPKGYGLVVNPGTPNGFDISPEGIAQIVLQMSASRTTV